MEEVEVEIVLERLPDVPRLVEGLGKFLGLEPASMGMTSTFDRLLDTDAHDFLVKEQSLRVRQKLENVYSGGEFRLTYKRPLRTHERLLIRDEEKLKLADTDIETVIQVLGAMAEGIAGHGLSSKLLINELAREANLGPRGERVNLSVDTTTYSLPDSDVTAQEFVLEIESHGVDDDTILRACDWVLTEIGHGRVATQGKYARGLKLLGR